MFLKEYWWNSEDHKMLIRISTPNWFSYNFYVFIMLIVKFSPVILTQHILLFCFNYFRNKSIKKEYFSAEANEIYYMLQCYSVDLSRNFSKIASVISQNFTHCIEHWLPEMHYKTSHIRPRDLLTLLWKKSNGIDNTS